MKRLAISRKKSKSVPHRMLSLLVFSLGALALVAFSFSSAQPSLTGYSIMHKVYGGAAPLVMVVTLGALIFFYTRIFKD